MNAPGVINNWIVLLVILPMATGIATMLLRGRILAQRLVGLTSLGVMTLLCISWLVMIHPEGVFVSQMGDWPAPFGISIVFDELSGLLLTASCVVGFSCLLFSTGADVERDSRTWFHPLTHMLMLGVCFSFLTGDLFNLFVAFEIMLMASYSLLCLGGTRRQLSQAYKYVMLNLIGSTFFVVGAGMVYGMMGTLNFADLAIMVRESQIPGGEGLPPAFPAVSMMLLFVFALKAAAFPLWFWLPDTYHTCPITIGALFGGLLTKVGVYSICRVFPMIFAADVIRGDSPVVMVLLIAAAMTMLLAALAALVMKEIRRLLSMVVISSIGMQLFGAGMMTEGSLAGSAFYMTQSMIATAAGFLCCGLVERSTGTDRIDALGGLYKRAPVAALLFLMTVLCLSGMPPLAGFFAKAVILREGFTGPAGMHWWVVSVIGLLSGALLLLALFRMWTAVFWGPAPETPIEPSKSRSMGNKSMAVFATALLVCVFTAMGVLTEFPMRISNSAGAAAVDGRRYTEAVLPGAEWPSLVRGEDGQWRLPPVSATREQPVDRREDGSQ